MKQTIHGGYYGSSPRIIDFSVNLNPLGTPTELRQEIENCFREGVLNRYPDYNYSKLISAITYFFKLSQGYVIPTNGASEGINTSMYAVRPKELVIIEPTYGDYMSLANALNLKVKHFLMAEKGKEFKIDTQDLIRSVRNLRKNILIVWTNPNNPTGSFSPINNIIDVALEVLGKAFLLVDEAYAELSGIDGIISLSDLPSNVIVIRSFTKVFSLPGLRAGFIYLNNKELASRISSLLPSWNINSLAECSFKKALRNYKKELYAFINHSANEVARLRTELANSLSSLGLKVFNSVTNFLVVKHEGISTKLLQKDLLIKHGIYIRPAYTFYGLNLYYSRVAVRNSIDNSLLVRSVEEVLRDL